MPESQVGGVWPAVGPRTWPAAPDEMTVSTLGEIEACPRRWALASAEYPELWSRRGYPPRLHTPSLAGSVIHLVLETVTKALTRAGCASVRDSGAVQVMKELGGYTKLVNDCIDRVVHRFGDNPRAARVLETALRSLRSQVPAMRAQAQSLLGRLRLHGGPAGPGTRPTERTRTPVRHGVHPELELRAPKIGWRGKADIVVVSPDICEIIDFKTGAQDDAHGFQLRVYALLWARDGELNPSAARVGKLTLSYRTGDVEVDPPSSAELDALERDLVARREAAMKAVSAQPPEARPSAETCRYCAVRQLCEVYWQPTTERRPSGTNEETPFMDLEISLVGRHGPSSWDAVEVVSRGPDAGKRVLLRVASTAADLRTGDRVRVLDAHVSTDPDDESQPAVVTMTSLSEIFLVRRVRS